MRFWLGTTCWHVVRDQEDYGDRRSWCGRDPGDFGMGGGVDDVRASDMPVCWRCDRSTDGAAGRLVDP